MKEGRWVKKNNNNNQNPKTKIFCPCRKSVKSLISATGPNSNESPIELRIRVKGEEWVQV